MVMPEERQSTRNWLSPWCRAFGSGAGAVRSRAIMKSQRCALVVQTLRPLIFQPPGTFSALVRRLARSEPLSGSDRPMAKARSPETMRGRNSRRCSSVPRRRISGPDCRSPIQCAPTGAPTASISSSTT